MGEKSLGDHNPQTLLNTLFFYTGKFFALRGGHEHRQLEWGRHIQLHKCEQGEYLMYTNNFSKNYQGGLNQAQVKPKEVKVFSNNLNPERCFIRIYKKYASLRPQNGKANAYYLRPKSNENNGKWFDDMAVGHNTLNNITKNLCASGGLTGGNFRNHSLKKTAATSLRYCPEVQRRAITGNRSQAQSVYECVTDDDY